MQVDYSTKNIWTMKEIDIIQQIKLGEVSKVLFNADSDIKPIYFDGNSDTRRLKITNKQRDIVNFCSVPRSSKEIFERAGVTYIVRIFRHTLCHLSSLAISRWPIQSILMPVIKNIGEVKNELIYIHQQERQHTDMRIWKSSWFHYKQRQIVQ